MLVAHPFDADAGELTGDPIPLADDVGATSVGLADFSASVNGTLAFRSGDIGGRQLLWRDREGREVEPLAQGQEFRSMALSPDGRRVVVDVIDDDANLDLWIHDLERGVASRFTFQPERDQVPVWSPDGSRIVFSSERDGGIANLWVKDASGAGSADLLLSVGEDIFANDWTRDGRFLILMRRGGETDWDIWALPMDGSSEPFPVLQSQFAEVRARFSPDGKWFVYQSNESGDSEIYVRPFPGPGGQWQVSTNGGVEPRWSDDGREIFYLDATRNMVSVPVELGQTFEAGLPEILFEGRLFPVVQRNRYVASRDGQRFLTLSPMTGTAIPPTTVVLNWHAGLER
jgi:Tol biopolymer transport system component